MIASIYWPSICRTGPWWWVHIFHMCDDHRVDTEWSSFSINIFRRYSKYCMYGHWEQCMSYTHQIGGRYWSGEICEALSYEGSLTACEFPFGRFISWTTESFFTAGMNVFCAIWIITFKLWIYRPIAIGVPISPSVVHQISPIVNILLTFELPIWCV